MQSCVTKQWFKAWSNEYDRTLGGLSFHKGLLEAAVDISAIKQGDIVLDIGCGTGLLSLKFLAKKDCNITAIDNSREMIGVFRDKIKKLRLDRKVCVRLMDANKLNFPEGHFDIVASVLTLHHIKDKYAVLRQVHRILKSGGRFVLGDIDMDTRGDLHDTSRLKRILRVLEDEWITAMREKGLDSFSRLFDNGKKHIFNDGEYCVSFKEWAGLCREAGLTPVRVKAVRGHNEFKALACLKEK